MEIKYHYDLSGAEPIIRDVPLYDGTTIVKGQFVRMDTTDIGVQTRFITGFVTGSANEMREGLGICNETLVAGSYADWGDYISTAQTTTTPAISTIATSIANGSRFGKCIINPMAVYLVEYDMTAGDDFSSVACSTTTYTTAGTGEDNCEGAWLYWTDLSVTAGVVGQLRYITATTTTVSWTLDSAPTVASTTSDNLIRIKEHNNRFTTLNNEATGFGNDDETVGTGINLHCLQSYIGGSRPLEPLRKQVHGGLDLGANSGTKFFTDVVITDHCYNMQSSI